LRGGATYLVYSLYMERLPYIDEHSVRIGATREEVWSALASMLHRALGGSAPGLFARLLGAEPVIVRRMPRRVASRV
jgi:hypothetical protein